MSNKHNAREAIVDSASRLFFTQGYHATGLNQIIKDSDSPKGSLYYYFPHGKEELAVTCIKRTSDVVAEKLKTEVDKAGSAAAGVQEFILGMAREAVESSFEGVVPFSFWLAVETSCISEELRTASQAVFHDWQEVIVQRLMAEGEEQLKAEAKASAAISLFEGALIQALTRRSEQPLLAAAECVPAVLG
ncbi:TetR/AcrR family transcriptional regulator ['Paenibacillus yunnanensis' Narsing Rao et al. 2020]|uniref:TetR/AcrR family transcriptional regulator n=1 Tax=Paenibacillus tengchongensis TaxID=2608684 RepID=UPI00124E5AAD|nr:TetR/AcrR family transcriptional regulator [Paenibacillus tengchongensis]